MFKYKFIFLFSSIFAFLFAHEQTAISHSWNPLEYQKNSSIQKSAAEEMIEKIQFSGRESVLDIGCGEGKITALIAKKVPQGKILGIDISPSMIQFAKDNFPSSIHKNLNFLTKDASQIESTQEFEVIFSSFALQWLKDGPGFFKKAHKSLKEGGCLVATIPLDVSMQLETAIAETISEDKWSPYFKDFSPGWCFLRPTEYAHALNDSGLKTSYFKVKKQERTFESREEFENYVKQWFSYSAPLPENLKSVFFFEVVEKYLEMIGVRENGPVNFSFYRVDLIAKK
jgi:trans-aconitate methyltransferase